MAVEVATNSTELEAHRDAWRRLLATTVEPNAFLEPSFFLPAWEALGDRGVRVALVYAENRQNPSGPRVLAGLFPLRRRLFGRFGDGLWLHAFAFLGTPLVRRDFLPEALGAWLDWLAEERRDALVALPKLHAGGPFHRELVRTVRARDLAFWVQEQYLRAYFEPSGSAEEHALRAVSRDTRRESRRLTKKLAESGPVEHRVLPRDADPGELAGWTDTFLELEAGGWKGRRGTAFRSRPATERFFRAALAGAFEEERLVLTRLDHGGRALAMGCGFTSGDTGFYFKIAHDERFARYSPGTLLELASLEWLHGPDAPRCFDSCADAEHPLIDRIWDARRPIQSLWIATGRRGGAFALATLPLARGARRAAKRVSGPRRASR